MNFGQFLDSKSYDQVCKYVSMQVCKYASIQVYASMQAFTDKQVCKYASMQVCKY